METDAAASPIERRHRVVLDLQACQTEDSRHRGIGRYSSSLAEALTGSETGFDYAIAVNDAFRDSAAEIERRFETRPGVRQVVRYAATTPSGPWTPGVVDAGRIAGEWIAQYAWTAQKPDIVHVGSLFEGSTGRAVVPDLVGLPSSTVVCATAYDLIPLVEAERYLVDGRTRAWYQSRIQRLSRCDLLLAISDATRRDLIARLGIPEARVVSIQGGVGKRFCAADASSARAEEFARSLGIVQPYVMYTGGIDYRKNLEATIRAFGLLPDPLRRGHQLAIVCSASDADRARLLGVAKSAGLAPGVVVLTGFVPDEVLVDLYRRCRLFVFPSSYEGFGLPVLEAMACGAPTIAANRSSLPEIVGRADALFDVGSDEAIAGAIAHALASPGFLRELAAYGVERAKQFTWDRVAGRTRDAWLDALGRKCRSAVIAPRQRPRMALVSPLLPERSGVAEFVTAFLPYLARHFRIELFVSEAVDARRYQASGFEVHPWHDLPGMWADFEAGVVYEFGNSSFHAHMLELLRRCPGVVVLHDAYLSGLMDWLETGAPRLHGFFDRMLAYCDGINTDVNAGARDRARIIDTHPMCAWVADHATGVVVTSEHARDVLAENRQIDGSRCRIVPLQSAVRVMSHVDRVAAKRVLGIADSTLLVCSFGYAADRKLSHELVVAWTRAQLPATAELVFVGEAEGSYGRALAREIKAARRGGAIRVTGYVADDAFATYLDAADLVVQLRKDTRGEASGAALYALARGKPLIASRHGSLAEIPDDACVHVDDPLDADALADALAALAADGKRREETGLRGQEWVRSTCDPGAAARAMAEAVFAFNDTRIVHRRRDLAERLDVVAEGARGSLRDDKARVIGPGSPGVWTREILARACRADRPRPDDPVARTLARSLMTLVPVTGFAPDAPRSAMRAPEPGTTLVLAAADSALMTQCGVKSDDSIRTTGRAGALMYGPYLPAGRGRYRVRLFGTIASPCTSPHTALEIACDAGARVVARCALPQDGVRSAAAGLIARLDFDLGADTADLEFRVLVTNDDALVIESVEIVALAG
jgi:glycosyltransferase involved in cell wall biosynthesis